MNFTISDLQVSSTQVKNTDNKQMIKLNCESVYRQNLGMNSLIDSLKKDEAGRWVSECRDRVLSSVFQPVISLNQGRIIGQEALLRVRDVQGVSIDPTKLIGAMKSDAEVIELDRLCRLLHSHNYMQQPDAREWLFLNLTPQVINRGYLYGSFFSELLQLARINPSQVVVEVLENQVSSEKQLSESVNYYRDIGCLIAIDDFGVGHSNIDRVLRLEPDIVKLDRSLLEVSSCKARKVLSNLVSLLHEAECLVVLEGVETLDHVMLAYDVNADLVQGYFFSAPVPDPVRNLQDNLFTELQKEHKKHHRHLASQQCSKRTRQNAIFEELLTEV